MLVGPGCTGSIIECCALIDPCRGKKTLNFRRRGILDLWMCNVHTDYSVQGDTFYYPQKLILDLRKPTGNRSRSEGSVFVMLSRLQSLDQIALLAPLWLPGDKNARRDYINWLRSEVAISADKAADFTRLSKLAEDTKVTYAQQYNQAVEIHNLWKQQQPGTKVPSVRAGKRKQEDRLLSGTKRRDQHPHDNLLSNESLDEIYGAHD
jgi:hypothetical protein